jgi:hypothetical protein
MGTGWWEKILKAPRVGRLPNQNDGYEEADLDARKGAVIAYPTLLLTISPSESAET